MAEPNVETVRPRFTTCPSCLLPNDTSVGVPLLSGLLGDAEKRADLGPRVVVEEPELVHLAGDVALDGCASSDQGFEVGLGVRHASILVDGREFRQPMLTPTFSPETTPRP